MLPGSQPIESSLCNPDPPHRKSPEQNGFPRLSRPCLQSPPAGRVPACTCLKRLPPWGLSSPCLQSPQYRLDPGPCASGSAPSGSLGSLPCSPDCASGTPANTRDSGLSNALRHEPGSLCRPHPGQASPGSSAASGLAGNLAGCSRTVDLSNGEMAGSFFRSARTVLFPSNTSRFAFIEKCFPLSGWISQVAQPGWVRFPLPAARRRTLRWVHSSVGGGFTSGRS